MGQPLNDLQELILSHLDEDDIQQEIELRKLEGKDRVSRKIIIQQMIRENTDLHFANSQDLPDDALAVSKGSPQPDPGTLKALVDWSIDQPEEIQAMVFGFLDDPTDEKLKELTKWLKAHGVEITKLEKPPRGSFADLLRRHLAAVGESSMEELYQLARNTHTTERPEATTRQLVRRLLKAGELQEDTNGRISLV